MLATRRYFFTIFAWWQKDPDPEPDLHLWLTDPDPGGPKTYGSGSPTPVKKLFFFFQGSKIWQEVKEAKDAESEQESVGSEPAKEEEEEEGEEEEKKEEEENSQILDTVLKASLLNSIYFN